MRHDHRRELKRLLPSVTIREDIMDVVQELSDELGSCECCCVDLSCMPRNVMFTLLPVLLRDFGGRGKVFIIYTYPREYVSGTLQEPADDVDEVSSAGPTVTGNPQLLLIPGFDREYCNLVAVRAPAE
jgi:hypothetical protein